MKRTVTEIVVISPIIGGLVFGPQSVPDVTRNLVADLVKSMLTIVSVYVGKMIATATTSKAPGEEKPPA
jgi:hypothetical protein